MEMLINIKNNLTEDEVFKAQIEDNYNSIPQKTKEYMELLNFLMDKENWDSEIVIIKGEYWDKFYESNDKYIEMNILAWIQPKDFFDKFLELVNCDNWKFERYFVTCRYIDEWTYNTMNLIVNINGRNERFIIDTV